MNLLVTLRGVLHWRDSGTMTEPWKKILSEEPGEQGREWRSHKVGLC